MAKILNQKWPRFAPKLAVQWPKYDFLDHVYLCYKIVPTVICIKKQYQTLDPNSLDYQNRPESPRIAPNRGCTVAKILGKIARILVQWLLVGSGLLTKITLHVHTTSHVTATSTELLYGEVI